MTRLVIAEPAANDLDAIVEYIALDNPQAAYGVFRAIMETARKLPLFPRLGRPGRVPGTWELTVPALPYLLVYQVADDVVTILAVFYTSRNHAHSMQDRNGPQ